MTKKNKGKSAARKAQQKGGAYHHHLQVLTKKEDAVQAAPTFHVHEKWDVLYSDMPHKFPEGMCSNTSELTYIEATNRFIEQRELIELDDIKLAPGASFVSRSLRVCQPGETPAVFAESVDTKTKLGLIETPDLPIPKLQDLPKVVEPERSSHRKYLEEKLTKADREKLASAVSSDLEALNKIDLFRDVAAAQTRRSILRSILLDIRAVPAISFDVLYSQRDHYRDWRGSHVDYLGEVQDLSGNKIDLFAEVLIEKHTLLDSKGEKVPSDRLRAFGVVPEATGAIAFFTHCKSGDKVELFVSGKVPADSKDPVLKRLKYNQALKRINVEEVLSPETIKNVVEPYVSTAKEQPVAPPIESEEKELEVEDILLILRRDDEPKDLFDRRTLVRYLGTFDIEGKRKEVFAEEGYRVLSAGERHAPFIPGAAPSSPLKGLEKTEFHRLLQRATKDNATVVAVASIEDSFEGPFINLAEMPMTFGSNDMPALLEAIDPEWVLENRAFAERKKAASDYHKEVEVTEQLLQDFIRQ